MVGLNCQQWKTLKSKTCVETLNAAGISARASTRPQSAAVLRSGSPYSNDWTQLNTCMGEVDRLRSNIAKDAAAMQAMGVLVEAKALKLDIQGKHLPSAWHLV